MSSISEATAKRAPFAAALSLQEEHGPECCLQECARQDELGDVEIDNDSCDIYQGCHKRR